MEANYSHVCDHIHYCDQCDRNWCTCELVAMRDVAEEGKTWFICSQCSKKLTWSKTTSSLSTQI